MTEEIRDCISNLTRGDMLNILTNDNFTIVCYYQEGFEVLTYSHLHTDGPDISYTNDTKSIDSNNIKSIRILIKNTKQN